VNVLVLAMTMRRVYVRGFSLLELMVTVAVVGILAGVGVFSVQALSQRGKSQSVAQSTASTLRSLRDRARQSQSSLIISPAPGGNGKVEITATPQPCGSVGSGCVDPDARINFDEGVDVFLGAKQVCIDGTGRTFKAPTNCAFVAGDLFVRLPSSVFSTANTCSDCVVVRALGMVDVVANNATSACSSTAQCGGAACINTRCVPREGLEHAGDFGVAFAER
jgi:prepilin-type N-terminal cleavage/methylation domain-containing protein